MYKKGYLKDLVSKGHLVCDNYTFVYDCKTGNVTVVEKHLSEVQTLTLENLKDFVNSKDDLRVCSECGSLMFDGWTDLYQVYACKPICFMNHMNSTYGKGKWRSCELNSNDGYWKVLNPNGEWEDVEYFYTSWSNKFSYYRDDELKQIK